jgi:hypothetical protein
LTLQVSIIILLRIVASHLHFLTLDAKAQYVDVKSLSHGGTLHESSPSGITFDHEVWKVFSLAIHPYFFLYSPYETESLLVDRRRIYEEEDAFRVDDRNPRFVLIIRLYLYYYPRTRKVACKASGALPHLGIGQLISGESYQSND